MKQYLVLNLAYGYGSWGDEMILDGVLTRLGRSNCTVYSWDPDETRAMHNVSAVGPNEPFQPHDTLWIGGSGWGYGDHAPNLCREIKGALDHGKEVVIEAAGLRAHPHWRGMGKVLRRVDSMTVRDTFSQQLARDEIGRECEIVPDPSLSMGIEDVLLEQGIWAGINVVNDPIALGKVAPICEILANSGYQLLALPTIAHKRTARLNGHIAAQKLGKMVGATVQDIKGPWYGGSLGPRQLAGLAQHCAIMVAMRKHGCWLAQRTQRRVLMLDWFDDHGNDHRLGPLRELIPNSSYYDLHTEHDPQMAVKRFLQ